MYTEEYESRGTPIKDLIIRSIIVVIVLITAFIIAKVSTKEEYLNSEGIITNPYKNATYKENIEHLTSVALGYFDEDKLKEIKKKKFKITIKDLIDEGILVPVVDENDKICNAKKSYIQITPYGEDEYVLKTKLKCSKDDDYVLKHLGHYNYCSDYLCEKEDITISTKATSPSKTVKVAEEKKPNEDITARPMEKLPYVPSENTSVQYQYAKTTKAKIDSWSPWSGWIKTSCDTAEENCDDKDPTCRRKIVLYNQEEKVSSYNNKYDSNRKGLSQTTTSSIKACSQYNYVIIDNVVYATNAVYTIVNSINSSTKSTQGNWEYKGEKSFDKPPSDTVSKIYKFVKIDFEKCEETCVDKPLKYIYDVYEFKGTLSNASEDASLLCQGSTTKTVAVYQISDVNDTQTRKEPVYGKVCYYNMKTRKITSKGKTKKVYSSLNDETLLSNDYYYTGEMKEFVDEQKNQVTTTNQTKKTTKKETKEETQKSSKKQNS